MYILVGRKKQPPTRAAHILQSALQPRKVIFAWPVGFWPYMSHRLPNVPKLPRLAVVQYALKERCVEFLVT